MRNESTEYYTGFAAGLADIAYSNPFRPYSVAANAFQRGFKAGRALALRRKGDTDGYLP